MNNKSVFPAILFASTAVFIIILNVWLRSPQDNYSVLSLSIILLFSRNNMNYGAQLMFFAAAVLFTGVLLFPLKQITPLIALIAVIQYASVYLLTMPFLSHIAGIEERKAGLGENKRLLEAGKQDSLDGAMLKDDLLEKQIKDIRSLYDAAKELGSSLNHEETIELTTAVLKKIIRNNFKISPDDITFMIIFKKEYEYYIAQSFGYDEESIRDNEKTFVNAILKSVGKSQEYIYIQDTSKIPGDAGLTMELNKCVIYIPFYVKNKLLGVLFISGSKINMFDEKQIESIRMLSNQIAISLEKVHLYEEVEKLSETDSLTGLYVHRYFQDKLENEIKRTQRYGGTLSLVLGDIDHFKVINDTYGHLAGDYILKTIAVILKNHTSIMDSVARYGGEEFVIILPDTDKEKAHAKAVKIRKEIEKYPFKYKEIQIKITMSMGVAAYPLDADARRTLIDKADKALYRAKEEGRNRVIRAE